MRQTHTTSSSSTSPCRLCFQRQFSTRINYYLYLCPPLPRTECLGSKMEMKMKAQDGSVNEYISEIVLLLHTNTTFLHPEHSQSRYRTCTVQYIYTSPFLLATKTSFKETTQAIRSLVKRRKEACLLYGRGKNQKNALPRSIRNRFFSFLSVTGYGSLL